MKLDGINYFSWQDRLFICLPNLQDIDSQLPKEIGLIDMRRKNHTKRLSKKLLGFLIKKLFTKQSIDCLKNEHYNRYNNQTHLYCMTGIFSSIYINKINDNEDLSTSLAIKNLVEWAKKNNIKVNINKKG